MIIPVKIPPVPNRSKPPAPDLQPLITVSVLLVTFNKVKVPPLMTNSGIVIKKAKTANKAPLTGSRFIFSSSRIILVYS